MEFYQSLETQVSVDFSVYVSGYEKNRSTTNLLVDDNPDLELVSSEHVCESNWMWSLSPLDAKLWMAFHMKWFNIVVNLSSRHGARL